MKPLVIVDPSFRTMDEIFDAATQARLHDVADVAWGRDEPMPTVDFLAAVPEAHAVVFGEWRHGRNWLDKAGPNLQAVLEVAGGHHHPDIDYDACLDRGLRIGSCAPAFGPAVAEMGLALTLDAMRGVTAADRAMRAGTEGWIHEGNVGNTSLLGATVGFVGCGGLSVHLQSLLSPFGVEVLGFDPHLPADQLIVRGITHVALDELFARADVVYVLAAPTADNEGLVSADLLASLQPSQTLIVLSRAHLVDFDALTELVTAGRFKAGIDVFPVEPLPVDHPIRQAEAAVCVPHIAGSLPATLHEVGRSAVHDLTAILGGTEPTRMQYLTRAAAGGLLRHSLDDEPDDEPEDGPGNA